MKYVWNILGACLLSASVMANELDLYLGEPKDVPARIMLLVDTSGSMDDDLEGNACADGDTNCKTKMQILQETLLRFVDADDESANDDIRWPDNYSVGLVRFNVPGGSVLAEVLPLSTVVGGQTHRQRLANVIANLPTRDFTPLVGSYLDTIEYLKGGRAVSGVDSISQAWANPAVSQYAVGLSETLICNRTNDHLVVLTDGVSNNEGMSDRIAGCGGQGAICTTTIGQLLRSRVENTPANNMYLTECPDWIDTDDDPENQTQINSNRQIWQCANALARSIVDKRDLTNITGIRTHTIAYNLGDGSNCTEMIANPDTPAEHLCNWAKEGGGSSYIANDAAGLVSAFQNLLGEFSFSESFTTTVPGVSVNQSNRFSFLDDIYYSVFKPSDRRVWYGNLKKYRLDFQGGESVIVGDGTGRVDDNNIGGEDLNGNVVGDGFFDADARSYWFNARDYDPDTITADGDNVVLGGAAMRIPDKVGRQLFTSLNNNTTIEVDDAHLTNVSAAMMPSSFPSEEARDEMQSKITDVVNWLRGDDIHDEWVRVTLDLPVSQEQVAKPTRRLYGASIHSSPVLINYTSTGGSRDEPRPLLPHQQDNLVFISTNDGKLYGVDGNTGNEKLAFVPGVLLTRPSDSTPSMIESYYDAIEGNLPGDFIYGLDSTWTAWRQDVNGDGNITSSGSNDFVYLYGGMRRGGRHYYGLDVTEANDSQPELSQLFVLEGGEANTATENMGQTWSEPVLGLIKYNGEGVVAMIVGGGYDPLYDTRLPAANERPQGAQLYIVAAHRRGNTIRAGEILWWGSSSSQSEPGNHQSVAALTDSVPSAVKVLDKDGDGYLDHIYVADLGGTLMRFDINNQNTGASTLITNTDNVVVAELGEDAVSPLSAADRRFFYPPSIALMRDIRGKHVAIAIGSGLITDPKNSSADERMFFYKDYAPFGVTVAAADNPVVSNELTLESEKMLGSPLIVGGMAFFSTYYWGDNNSANADPCRPTYGRAALYSYDPMLGETTLIGKAYPQSLAGSLTTILQTIPEQRNAEGELIRPGGTDFIGIGGTSAFDLPDVDLGNIRKTRWRQCPPSEDGDCE